MLVKALIMSDLNFLKQNQCYIIAEAGLNHNGSVDIAKNLIDVAAISGVDAIKFQKRTVEKLAVKNVLDASDERFPEFGKSYREIREYLEFNFDEYVELKKYSESKGLDFLVTAFDIDAVNFLEDLEIKVYKLASHSLTNIDLLQYLAKKKKQTILSTGMADWEEIDQAVSIFTSINAPLALMHCVSSYPTSLPDSNIAAIEELKKRYRLKIGYSGHEIGYLPTLIAVARGAEIIERHFTLDKTMAGFDHKISLEPNELIAMVKNIRDIPIIIGSGEKKVSENEWITRKKYHVSMVSSVQIPAGTELTEAMVVYRNPGTGIPYKEAYKILGKRAVFDIPENELLTLDMFK